MFLVGACDPLVDRGSLSHADGAGPADADSPEAPSPAEVAAPDIEAAVFVDSAPDGDEAGDVSSPETEVQDADVVEDACVPDCQGKQCGPDGCGGSCGSCPTACPAGPLGPVGQKIVKLAVGSGGYPGQSLDIDEDSTTCSPAQFCQDGIDNMLSSLTTQLLQFVDTSSELSKALEAGDVILVLESPAWNKDSSAFLLRIWGGTPNHPKETCDFQTEECDFAVSPLPDGTCGPLAELDNARFVDGVLTAGGVSATMKLVLPYGNGVFLTVTVHLLHLVAQEVPFGDGWALGSGVMAGAIPKNDLMEAVDSLPDDAGLPVSKDMVKNLLDMFVKPDIDTDGDGELDAASIGLVFQTIPAVLEGLPSGLTCQDDGLCVPGPGGP
ncbi:MAG: hypothetical protein FJ109_08360 [Deltaproteobacteria bacterium]|nr:hypothetical protein [Deltaproteobacteria bacterium]